MNTPKYNASPSRVGATCALDGCHGYGTISVPYPCLMCSRYLIAHSHTGTQMPRPPQRPPFRPSAPRPPFRQPNPEESHGRMIPIKHTGPLPWVQLRNAIFHPSIFRKMIGRISPEARNGDLVAVSTTATPPRFGTGLLLHPGPHRPPHADLRPLTRRRIPHLPTPRRRRRSPHQPARPRYHHQRLPRRPRRRRCPPRPLLIDRFRRLLPSSNSSTFPCSAACRNHRRRTEKLFSRSKKSSSAPTSASRTTKASSSHRMPPPAHKSTAPPTANPPSSPRTTSASRSTSPTATKPASSPTSMRATGLHLTEFTEGKDVLDLCSYSGGFGVYAATLGKANHVTCVDLDEDAIAPRPSATPTSTRSTKPSIPPTPTPSPTSAN